MVVIHFYERLDTNLTQNIISEPPSLFNNLQKSDIHGTKYRNQLQNK